MKVLLIVYDNDAHLSYFPLGTAYIASAVRNAGHEVKIYNQDLHHYPEEHLTDYLNNNNFDMVGLGIIAGYYQYGKLLKISEAVNRSDKRPFYVLGGHGPSPEPEYFLKVTRADAVVIGEGEETIVELIKALENKEPLRGIKGIAFREGDKITINERRPIIKDVDSIAMPAWDLFPMNYYRLFRGAPHLSWSDFAILMISGRGCHFKCNFCYRMDEGCRPRTSQSIIEEIKILKERYGITYIAFWDELLMSSIDRTKSLCEDMLKAKLGIKWMCNGRLNYSKPDVLALMKKAGCVFINYGIEAMDDTVLRNMNKSLTTKQIYEGIEATLKAGISPGFNIIFGNIGDSQETLNKGVEFLMRYDDGAQLRTIRPVTPYPGAPLYYYAIEKGLLKDCEDFYKNKHLNSDLVSVNFTDMTDDDFHKALLKANNTLLENYYKKKLDSSIRQSRKLYLELDTNFRGYRHHFNEQ